MVNLMDYKLRELEEEDLKLILMWRNSDIVRKNMFSDKIITFKEHRRWFDKIQNEKTNKYKVFYYKEKPIGLIYFVNIDRNNGTCYWGFYLGEEYSKGHGTILGYLGLKYAYNNLKLKKVYGEVIEYNNASISLHEKLGFVQEGNLRKHIFRENCYLDVILFGQLDTEWKENNYKVMNLIT